MLALSPFYMSLVKGAIFNDWRVYTVLVSSGVIACYYGLTTRLIASANGITSYFLYPFHFRFSWKELDFIYLEDSGVVYLYWNADEKGWFHRIFGGRLQLSLFVDDWKNSEFILELRTYAPHLKISENILTQPKYAIWHRPGVMLFYYLACLIPAFLLAALTNLPFLNPIRITLVLAIWGFVTGIMVGMLSLINYSAWLNRRKNKFIGKIWEMAKRNYSLPFIGWAIAFIFGLLAQGLFTGWGYISQRDEKLLSGINFLLISFILVVFFTLHENS